MSKKFSTLLAGIVLAGSMSVNAQNLGVVESGKAPTISGVGSVLPGLNKDNKGGLYQLKDVYGNFLLMQETLAGSGEYTLVVKKKLVGLTDLENSLWCVTPESFNQGQSVKFDFMNKGTGMMLDMVMPATNDYAKGELWTPTLGGDVAGWAFSRTVEKLEQKMPLYSGFKTDSVVGLKVVGSDTDGYEVKAAKYGRNEVKIDTEAAADADYASTNTFTGFTLYSAAEVALTETQLNTIFGVQKGDAGVKLGFDPDVKGTSLKNPFNSQKFIVEDSGDDLSGVGDWLYVRQKDEDAYLKVDTAYTNETGVKFLAYGWTKDSDDAKALARVNASTIKDQHKFLFVYSPSTDDLKIYVKQITWLGDDERKKGVEYWKEIVKSSDLLDPTDLTTSHKRGNWRVSLQDLIKDETRILTVDAKEQNTKISLGYGGCEAAEQTKTSLKDGVYYITNGEGKYLASPIHKNGVFEWTTVDPEEQNVAHMPAYQWIILKKNSTSSSPVELINREYPAGTNGNEANYSLSLNKKEGANSYYVRVDVSSQGNVSILSKDSLNFTLVPESSVKDSLLGYKNLTKEELLVNKYTFNYWHPYATDRFIAKSSKDSTLTVNVLEDGKSAFNLDTASRGVKNYAVEKFGYMLPKGIQSRISGLAQLYRTAYVVTLNGNGLAINKEAKFNTTKYIGDKYDKNEAVTPFFFKENNHITETGKCYYAILSTKATTDNGTTSYEIFNEKKAGVSDYDGNATLKSQALAETRTSAFAIEPDNTPLYRRFSSLELEGNEGDKADTLRFIEKYRKEYLQVENNPNFMKDGIEFLGIYTPDKTEDGLSFIVDTAWVNRGAGNVKPQYLISIDRNDFEGVEGIPCTEDDHHFTADGKPTDKWHCVHAKPAVPGFERGRYLINFHDFANNHVTEPAKLNADYMWKMYDRAGFVEAIRVADTLYVLRDEFKGLANEKISFEALNKAEKDAEAAAKKDGKKYISYKYILSGDNHKYVTWSMRFFDQNIAANEVEADRAFLFESMKYTKNTADYTADKSDIAPLYAAWLRMQNGCLVLSDASKSKFNDQTSGDDALIFNVEQGDDIATDNETIEAVEGVSITTDNGTVTIQGAAGKSVVISNILGKVVAETVLTSDNATIAVPAGIVAVAVDGEEAVKVVVK